MKNEKLTIFLHVVIALLCLPIHFYMGETLKLALLPYVLYMLFSKNPNYFPALIIHSIPGNTVSLVVLFACIWIALMNYKNLHRLKVKKLLNALLILLPVFLYFFYYNLFIRKIGFSFSLLYISYYMSFFVFFYGVLIAHKLTKSHWRAIVLVVFLMPFLMYLPLNIDIVIRLFWMALPLSITFLVTGFMGEKLRQSGFLMFWSLFFILLMGIPYGLKFTPIFSSILAISILLFYLKGFNFFLKTLTKARVGIIFTLLIILAINSLPEYSLKIANLGKMEITDFNSFMAYLKFKIFDDRAVIWKGGWEFLWTTDHFWPTGEVPMYSYITSTGGKMDEIGFGIHNLGLELMRNYGIIIGTYLICLYVIMITKLNAVIKVIKNSFILVLCAVLIGIGIAEAVVGQAVLMPMISFAFIGLVGICFGYGKLNDANNNG